MSLPPFSTQSELFSTAGLSASLFPSTDRYRLFANLIYPHLAQTRDTLAKCYCTENGRTALEPVLMLGVSLLQELDGVPDRQAVELLRYHAGWNFALNRQLGDPGFHPTSLVNFRQRLQEHGQSALGFSTILEALVQAGLVSRQSRQRLDSTQMFGRVARMSRLDCVRETLRLALQELESVTAPELRPIFWSALWDRYVESQADYRASAETLGRKLGEAGTEAWQLLEWLRNPAAGERSAGPQAQLLKRVFEEQFHLVGGPPAALSSGPQTLGVGQTNAVANPGAPGAPPVPPGGEICEGPGAENPPASNVSEQPSPVVVEPKGKGQLDSDRVQNPHDPEATCAVKGQGQQKKEHVGDKVQVAETVNPATLTPGEPTQNFITGIVTHPAHQSDEVGAVKMDQEQAQMGLEKPPVQYVDGA